MKAIPLWKALIFIFIVLPAFLVLLIVFFLPLILVLLFCMPLLAKRFSFRAGRFGRNGGTRPAEEASSAQYYDAGRDDGEIVDVEGIVVDADPKEEEEKASSPKLLPPHE